MNPKRLILASVAVFLGVWITDFLIHGVWLANTYKESGWLPEWASPGHRDCMVGSNSASIIADCYLKGIRGFDINTLYEGMVFPCYKGHEVKLHGVT